ncbi:hypothetical protein F4777DRAFT_566211 [Nemania sp. FL0916]|nr:hypothetical protein F4777DRAFT_566211 [Nemania sp. FL0916]
MSFQVSLGDGILLAKIAWRLAQTFTKGRHSAPTEFQEIENELYTLSAALTAAENEQSDSREAPNQIAAENNQPTVREDIFKRIIHNCKQTLSHLETIVDKYAVVSEEQDLDNTKLQRWGRSIVKNWRKIEWTTEKGDLTSLISQIMVHTNSLNLLVTIGTSSRAASIERSLDKRFALLEELHQWYVNNLKEATPMRSATSDKPIHAPVQTARVQPSSVILTFELVKKRDNRDEIICPCASLSSEWIEYFLSDSSGGGPGCMFACHCLDHGVGALSHQVAVQRYGLSHLIFPIRIANNDGSWMLYKTADRANNQLTNLYIRKIHSSYIRQLEDTFFCSLSSRRGAAILAQGAGNSLCYISPGDQEQHILEAMSDLSLSQKSIESITFRSGRSWHVREWVDDIQILQYRVQDPGFHKNGIQLNQTKWLEYAEVLVSFNAEDAMKNDDVITTVLKLKRNTVTELLGDGSVKIINVEAIGTHSDERTTTHTGLDVSIQFTAKSEAEEFREKIEAMRMELFVKSLRYPRSNEKVVLNLQTARVECESLYIDDAEICIVVDADAKYRLIIASRNRCTIISQDLVESFFTSPSSRPDYSGSTYIVQIEDSGERKIYHHQKGFRYLSLSTTQGNRMLELARSFVSFSIEDREQ